MKDNPGVIPVVEPRNVDDILETRVLKWISCLPAKVKFLLTDKLSVR